MRTDARTVPPAKDHVGNNPRSKTLSAVCRPAINEATVKNAGGKKSVLAGSLNEADVFVSASDDNVKSLVEHNWIFRIEARTCKCEWTYL